MTILMASSKRPMDSGTDPISPYLFILGIEGFPRSKLISKASSIGNFPSLKVCNKAPPISHLLFADVVLVFCKVNLVDSQVLTSILNQIQSLSSLQINFHNSVYFLLHYMIVFPMTISFSHNEEFHFRLILPWSLLVVS